MEGSYACNLVNRFELFLDDENDPFEVLARTEQEKRKTGDKKDSKKDAKKKGLSKSLVESVKTIAAAVDTTKPLGRQNTNAPPAAPNAPATRPPRRDNLEKRNNERNFEPRPEGDQRPPRENRGPRGDGQRGGPGGERRPFNRDGPRPRGEGPGGRGREFDRRSGDVRSGVKSVEKRGGQGQYNWGDPAESNVGDQEVPQDPRDENAEAAGEDAAVPAEPEVVEKTLDQWKKEMAAKKSKAEYAANIRKPNEGEKDDPKLKKAVVLKKKKTEESDDAEEDAEESEDETEKMKKQLEQTLASQFHFADQRGPTRGGRGGRSGGPPDRRSAPAYPAGNRPATSPRGPPHRQQQQHTPRVEDLNDFPSLAA